MFRLLQTLKKKERPQRENIAKRSYAEDEDEEAELIEMQKKKKSKLKFSTGSAGQGRSTRKNCIVSIAIKRVTNVSFICRGRKGTGDSH